MQVHAKQLALQRAARREEAQTRMLEARVHAEERRLDNASSGSSWVPLAIGLGVIAVIGVTGVVMYLMLRRPEGMQLGGAQLALSAPAQSPQVFVINAGGSPQPIAQLAAPLPAPEPVSKVPRYHDDPFSRRR